ncbi:MAG: hypothetical protein OJF49_000802 [Ktedonobacterales bacterium]|nr:MAG: hypothetical protein OJF49_000802 [Ktedonobacterales bacterium]
MLIYSLRTRLCKHIAGKPRPPLSLLCLPHTAMAAVFVAHHSTL